MRELINEDDRQVIMNWDDNRVVGICCEAVILTASRRMASRFFLFER